MQTTKRIPVLDGWRGVAILLVLLNHVQRTLPIRRFYPWMSCGAHGVAIFFVLSGYLITTNLLEHRPSFREFYIRRFFRLMPAAWVYLLTVALLVLLVLCFGRPSAVPAKEFASCVFFFRDYLGPQKTHLLDHFWSLSMEEQFYLVWPAVLFVLGPRRAGWIAAIGAAGCAAWRFLHHALYAGSEVLIYRPEVRADAILLGCLLAIVLWHRRNGDNDRIAKWLRVSTPILLAVAIGGVLFVHPLPSLFENASFALLFAATLLNSGSVLARVLSLKGLTWFGTVSYSLYLWQQMFTAYNFTVLTPIALPMIFICGVGSFYLIEKPMVRFGRQLANRLEQERSAPTIRARAK